MQSSTERSLLSTGLSRLKRTRSPTRVTPMGGLASRFATFSQMEPIGPHQRRRSVVVVQKLQQLSLPLVIDGGC